MSRYKYIPTMNKPAFIEDDLWNDDRKGLQPSLEVDDGRDVNTQLITADGMMIWRTRERAGFYV